MCKRYSEENNKKIINISEGKMIPKVIHYCWFGHNQKSELINKCICSLKKDMPDYEIKEWNESNFDISQTPFCEKAYNLKKWAFVSDYARFKILYELGGIYLDTDAELLKSIPNSILKQKAFTGVESTNRISPGLIFACEPKEPVVGEILDIYENNTFDEKTPITVNDIVTNLFKKKGYIVNGEFQIVDNIAIYPSEIFCGHDLDIGVTNPTEKTISVHHYEGSWKKRSVKSYVLRPLKKIIGIKKYEKLLLLKRRLVSKNDRR